MLITMLCWSPAAQIAGVIHPQEQHKHAAQTTGITHNSWSRKINISMAAVLALTGQDPLTQSV